jgi:glutaredoxin
MLLLHTKTDCPWCSSAKEWLADRNIPFTVIVHDDDAERQAFYDGLGLERSARTVPQVLLFEDGEQYRVGGFKELIGSGIESLFGRVS